MCFCATQDADGAAQEACAEVLAHLAKQVHLKNTQKGMQEQNGPLELIFSLLCDQNKGGQTSACLALSKVKINSSDFCSQLKKLVAL